jgi:predicted RNase H-like nuclease (RuvC/YqgF family)
VVEDRVEVKMKLEKQKEDMDRQAGEIAQLRQKIVDMDAEGLILRGISKEMQGVKAELASTAEALKRTEGEAEWARTQVKGKERECEELKKTIANL